MLEDNKEWLAGQIKEIFEQIVGPAINDAIKSQWDTPSKLGIRTADTFEETFIGESAEPFANAFAEALYSFAVNGDITGTIVTIGTPTTQYAKLLELGQIEKGKVPNSLLIE